MVHGMDRPLSQQERDIPLCYSLNPKERIRFECRFFNVYIYYTLHFHVTSKNSSTKKDWKSKPRSFIYRDRFFIRYFYLRSFSNHLNGRLFGVSTKKMLNHTDNESVEQTHVAQTSARLVSSEEIYIVDDYESLK